MNKERFSMVTVLLLTLGISALFFTMIKGFFMAIVLAAIFSGLLYGFNDKLSQKLKGRRQLASAITLVLFILVILIPVAAFAALVVAEAIKASQTLIPWVQELMDHPKSFIEELDRLPVVKTLFPNPEELLVKIEQAVQKLGDFVVNGLSALTSGTINFFFLAFMLLFTMYYFLVYGREYLERFLYYLPLRDEEEQMLLARFTTVTRATLKGTLIIGGVQGGLGAVAMGLAGIPNIAFWGVVMLVLSVIPAIGPALVWLPAGILLVISGQVFAGVALILFGVIVIGNIDNLLRPILVGKDAQLPDLMILFGTLGGLVLFGMMGIIIGPIVAALFVTLWEIYGETFKDYLHVVRLTKIVPPEEVLLKPEEVTDDKHHPEE